LDLIAVVEGALKEIVDLGHELAGQIILVTDNGPAIKARRFRNFVKKTELLIHVRSRKYHPQTIGREERFHGSTQARAFVSRAAQKSNRADPSRESLSTVLQSREAAHKPRIPHTGNGVSKQGQPLNSHSSAGKSCSEIVGQDTTRLTAMLKRGFPCLRMKETSFTRD
jgi:hypothetical protein